MSFRQNKRTLGQGGREVALEKEQGRAKWEGGQNSGFLSECTF